MPDFYDLDGEPIDFERWAELFEDWPGRCIARTEIGESYVSTVWLGIDHQFGDGPPLIFETMVFGGDHDGDQWRYSSRVQALAAHDQIVARLRAELVETK